MRRRSSKILAVTLALALGLNAMPFGALAVQETAGAVVSEETTLASTPETAATAETAQNTVEADANRADVAMLAEVYAQSSADAPMAVPGEALVIQNGVYYGISKSWCEPGKGKNVLCRFHTEFCDHHCQRRISGYLVLG